MCESEFKNRTHIDLQRDRMDSKSVELRFMSVRVGLGVPKITKCSFNTIFHKINGNSCVSDKTYNFPFSLANPFFSKTN